MKLLQPQIFIITIRLEEILTLGNFVADVNWLNFLSLACTSLESNLSDAVTLLCKILTKDPEGGRYIETAEYHVCNSFLRCATLAFRNLLVGT